LGAQSPQLPIHALCDEWAVVLTPGYALTLDGERKSLGRDSGQYLARSVLEAYRSRTGSHPLRMVIHKTSGFRPSEQTGFGAALRDIPIVEFVTRSERFSSSEIRRFDDDRRLAFGIQQQYAEVDAHSSVRSARRDDGRLSRSKRTSG
jgi:hypothetical protein